MDDASSVTVVGFGEERLTLVVEYDGQDGQLIPLTDPIYGSWYTEKVCPVADNLAYKSLIAHSELDSECSTS